MATIKLSRTQIANVAISYVKGRSKLQAAHGQKEHHSNGFDRVADLNDHS